MQFFYRQKLINLTLQWPLNFDLFPVLANIAFFKECSGNTAPVTRPTSPKPVLAMVVKQPDFELR